MELDHQVRALAEHLGADFYGVADLSSARAAILEQGGPVVAAFPRAIALGIALPHTIVDQLSQHDDRAVALTYRHQAYDVVNQRLDHMTSRVGGLLQRERYRALPVPASQRVDDGRLCALFSHKMAAHLAGLGWISKSCLLVTPQAGPRVRWATVLTEAPLGATGEPLEPRCGRCQECVGICPPRAFTGQPFRPEEPREVRFAAHRCEAYLASRQESIGVGTCGLCVYVCPHGRKEGSV